MGKLKKSITSGAKQVIVAGAVSAGLVGLAPLADKYVEYRDTTTIEEGVDKKHVPEVLAKYHAQYDPKNPSENPLSAPQLVKDHNDNCPEQHKYEDESHRGGILIMNRGKGEFYPDSVDTGTLQNKGGIYTGSVKRKPIQNQAPDQAPDKDR